MITGWPGRNGARCAATPIGPMPGPPPPCGMQKVLCRFRWQTSAPMAAGLVKPDLRVHVRAVHVNLAAVLVNDRADVLNAFLEHAVRRRIGHHQRGQIVAMLLRLSPSDRRRRCCLRRCSRPPPLACRPSPRWRDWCRARRPGSDTRRDACRRDRDDTRESPAGPRIRPASRRSAASETAAKPVISHSACFELLEDLLIAGGLLDRRERMEFRKFRPRDRQHLRRRVQLHGAGAERDHRRVEPTSLRSSARM